MLCALELVRVRVKVRVRVRVSEGLGLGFSVQGWQVATRQAEIAWSDR